MKIGLRVDVDTLRGTRLGVPGLCRLFDRRGIRASFFFSVGPDNMGRHVRRLLRPAFLVKMLRSRAASLYGWDILLRGTFFPGPVIGEQAGEHIRMAADAGHEIGLHAWDHHQWQARIDRMAPREIGRVMRQGVNRLAGLIGRPPSCSAVPGWRCTDAVLLEKSRLPFEYNSDCRGESIFYPVAGGRTLAQPQIPVTLPTYDEVVGRYGISDFNYNDYLFSRLRPGRLNVLTIHAEVEGIVRRPLFESFLERGRSLGITFVPLGRLLGRPSAIGTAAVVAKDFPGREGWISCQAKETV
jgi:undecaprenyl phosphate-alpha-L-ara4FN deformylase